MADPVKITTVRTGEETSRNIRDLAASRMREWINNYAAVNALFAFTESKLAADLQGSPEGLVDGREAAARHGYDGYQVCALLRFLSLQGMFIEEQAERFRLTPVGEALLSSASVGWMRLIRGGYGDTIHDCGALVEGRKRYGVDVERVGRYVGIGSSQFTSAIRDEVGYAALERIGARTIADLACGQADFSVNFVKRNPDHRAVAVDINDGSVSAARANVDANGVADRVTVVKADIIDPASMADSCRDVDTFFVFAMEHELLRDGDEAVIHHVEAMAKQFPGRRFIIGEAVNKITPDTALLYWFHALSLQGIPRDIEFWVALFGKVRGARLEEVFVPDYGRQAAYYCLKF